MIHRILFAVAVFTFAILSARADEIFVRGRPKIVAKIKTENARVIVFNEGKKKQPDETVQASEVQEVIPDSSTFGKLEAISAFKAGLAAEQSAANLEGANKKTAYETAQKKYDETLKKMSRDDVAQKIAARNLEYRIAMITDRMATDQVTSDLAVKRLLKFKTDHPDCWQINIVMPRVAHIQTEGKDYDQAAKIWQEIADLDVFSKAVREDAELKVVEMAVFAGKIDEANKKLDVIAKKAANNPTLAARVKMARANVLIGFKQPEKAFPLFQEVVKESNDKQVKALAHNALGEFYFKAGKFNEALWEFLWVDAVFNQDKVQHAKALFYLWKTFEQLNNAERAQECRDMLLTQPFNGTEHQKLAQQAK